MKELRGELFDQIGKVDFICITTNGTTKNDGSAVMGRGCALQAKTRWMGIDRHLGALLQEHGNVPLYLGVVDQNKVWRKGDARRSTTETGIISYPVKTSWNNPADIELIKQSAWHLKNFLANWQVCQCVIPRPGCGNGLLIWEEVGPQLAPILDDRFILITNEKH